MVILQSIRGSYLTHIKPLRVSKEEKDAFIFQNTESARITIDYLATVSITDWIIKEKS